MKIKKFNESIKLWDVAVFCVIICDTDAIDFAYQFSYSPCFTTEMLACDYLIKYVNDRYDENFEPFYTKEGDRFFLDIEENEDYKNCLFFCKENDIDITVESSHLYSKPRI